MKQMAQSNTNIKLSPTQRIRILYALLILVAIVFVIRLFYVQVIKYDYYKSAALSDQLKQYEIPATRGIIEVHNGDSILPIVLNQVLYTLYADPVYIKNADEVASKVQPIIGGDVSTIISKLNTKNTRYVVLAKKISPDQHNLITKLKYPGLGMIAIDYRTYPQANLASQLLGFVNDDGVGVYGLEQYLNKQLQGTPGQLKAITDIRGVPLAASKDNIDVAPKTGDNVVLTINIAMQQQLEAIIKTGTDRAKASGVSALIMDPNSGAIKAMANYPSYDPSQYSTVKDPSLFQNATVSQPIEIGSIMKVFVTSTALDLGVINANTTYFDPASWIVNGFKISNVEQDGGAGTRSIFDILNLSLNTGATWMLMQMGGGQINDKARSAWHDYMVNHFLFGKSTGVEQGYEASGYIPSPTDTGSAIDLTYANTAFGQAMTATPIQIASAFSSVVNGGTYYKPHLVDQTITSDGLINSFKPKVVETKVVSLKTRQDIISLMEQVVHTHYFTPAFDLGSYSIGGKTGTAQIAMPSGGYFENKYNGTYLGFVGGDKIQYVIVVFVNKPTISGYAGVATAQPVFSDIAHMLINNSYVIPRSVAH